MMQGDRFRSKHNLASAAEARFAVTAGQHLMHHLASINQESELLECTSCEMFSRLLRSAFILSLMVFYFLVKVMNVRPSVSLYVS